MFKTLFILTVAILLNFNLASSKDLESWTPEYKSIFVNYMKKITNKNSSKYIPIKDRVAVFDLDGTVITEKPHTLEQLLTNKRLLEKLEENPSLIRNPVYKAVKEGTPGFFSKLENVLKKIAEAFKGETMDFYMDYITDFWRTHENVKFGVPYRELIFKPMLELFSYLKKNKFKVFICSGTQELLVRVVAPDLNLDPNNMIGTIIKFELVEIRGKTTFKMLNKTVLPSANIEDKPVWIFERTGKRPVIAIANSYKDRYMLKYTSDSSYENLVMVLNHDDGEREVIHNRPKILRLARQEGWGIISMKDAFKEVF